MENQKSALIDELEKPKVKPVGYVALILGIIFFSGLLAKSNSFIRFFDFTVLMGKFGKIGTASNIQGTGGTGIRDSFMYVITIWPSIIFALGIINVIEGLDGLKAGQRLLNPILRPLLGVPGWSSLALVTSMTASSDAGAALTRDLVDNNLLTEQELAIFSCFNFVTPGLIGTALALAGTFLAPMTADGIPLIYVLIMATISKILAGNLMRLWIKLTQSKKK